MFCSKCGKTIDDNSPFCNFCGAPTGISAETVTNGAPQPVAPQEVFPQPTVPQQAAPQYGAPQAPQYGAPQQPQYGAPQQPQYGAPQQPQYGAPQQPQYGAPQQPQYGAPQQPQYGAPQQPQYGAPQQSPYGVPAVSKPALNLAPNVADLINKVLRGILAVLGILVIIGAIGTLATLGSMKKFSLTTSSTNDALKAVKSLIAFSNLARIPAIISFVLALGGAVLTYLTKSRSLFSYIAAGAGVLMFVFQFLLAKFSSIMSMLTVTESSYGAAIVGSIFLLISVLVMIVCSIVIILKKENIINYRPNF